MDNKFLALLKTLIDLTHKGEIVWQPEGEGDISYQIEAPLGDDKLQLKITRGLLVDVGEFFSFHMQRGEHQSRIDRAPKNGVIEKHLGNLFEAIYLKRIGIGLKAIETFPEHEDEDIVSYLDIVSVLKSLNKEEESETQ